MLLERAEHLGDGVSDFGAGRELFLEEVEDVFEVDDDGGKRAVVHARLEFSAKNVRMVGAQGLEPRTSSV